MRRILGNETARKAAAYAAVAALLVVLWGGYIRRWQWTGFEENGQLWNWLTLLLLPVVLGTIPLWIQYKEYIGTGRRVIYAVAVVAWTAFVIAGYLVPIEWTGFADQKLSGWLGLLMLPAAVATAMTLFDMSARGVKIRLGPYQKAIIAALAAGWIVTMIGGYALHWAWTGYGEKTRNPPLNPALNTLWDWLGLLLPLVFPIILLPPLVKWVSGNAAGRARAAQEAAAGRTATGGRVGVNQSVSRPGLWSVPGNGVLARQGDLILLSAIDEPRLAEKLLDSLANTSEGGGDGRRFADAVEVLVESDETWGGRHEGQPGPAVIAVGSVGAGLAVIVSGTAWAEITTVDGTDRLAAGQPATVLRCVVGIPVHAVRGGLGTGRGVGDRTDRFSRLDRGTVRAGGLSYHLGLPAAPPQGGAAPEAVVPAATPPGEAAVQPAAPPAWRRAWLAIAAAGVVVAVAVGGYLLVGGGGNSFCPAHGATAFATARALSCVHPRWTAVKGEPFDAAVAGAFGFVSYGSGVAVINMAESPPKTVRRIPLAGAQGEALTPGNKYLLVSGGSGAAVFKVSDLIQGKTRPFKLLNSWGGRHAVEVAVTPDGRFAFVTLQHSNQVAVFGLTRALASPAYESFPVGKVNVGPNPIGIAAPRGRYVYVATGLGNNCKISGQGALVVLDAAKAEENAPGARINEIHTESGLARVITSRDGKDVWVTAGCGNTLQAYSAAQLIHQHRNAPIAQVDVGRAPLGLVMVDHGRRIVLADSDRYDSGVQSDLAVIDVSRARAHQPAILGTIKSGKVPRQFALTPDGKTLLVTNTKSENVEVLNVSELP